jgi:hypothetical protein
MTLVDRYVGEVARHLPSRQREDVSRELRSTLRDTLESRFGPEPSEEDTVRLLKEFGPPEAMAASYRPSNRYLIGPDWFPAFIVVIRIHLLVLTAALVGGAALALVAPGRSLDIGGIVAEFVFDFAHVGLLSLGAIVLAFHLLERAQVQPRWPRREWDPRSLPAVKDRDRVEAVAYIVLTAVWLLILQQFRGAISVPGVENAPFLGNILLPNLPLLTVAGLLTMAQYAMLLWQGWWHWYTRATMIALDALGLYLTYLFSSAILGEMDALLQASMPAELVSLIEWSVYVGAVVTVGIILVDIAKHLLRTYRSQEARRSAPLNG